MKNTLFILCLILFVNNLLFSQITQIGNVINGAESNFQAGASLSFNNTGDVLAIGYLYTNGIFEDSGMGRVFETQNGEWIQKGSDIGNQYSDDKGHHVSLNGEGTVLAMSTGSYFGVESIVTIYNFINDDWQLMGNPIDINGGIAKLNNQGTTVIVSNSSSGELQVYEFINNDWQLKGDIIISPGIFWGLPVDINSTGNIIAALNFNGGTSEVNLHSILIYKFENNQWNQIGDLEAESSQVFTVNFDLNKQGDVCVISTFKEDVNEVIYFETKVYNFINEIWTQVGNEIIITPTDEFRYTESTTAINADGDIIAIGNPIENGSATLYRFINNEWVALGDGITGDGGEFGKALSFNDDATLLSVGAPKYSEIGYYFGQVRTYEIDYELFNVADNPVASNIVLYPNPTYDFINITTQDAVSINTIKIYDILGRLILEEKGDVNQLDVSSVSNGVLFIKIETAIGIITKKIIKH